jgi:hypothetical protein
LATYHKLQSEDRSQGLGPEMQRDPYFWDMTLNLGVRYEEGYIAWLDDTIAAIEHL